MNINCNGVSMSKIESKNIDVIGIYRSQGTNEKDLIEKVKILLDKGKTSIIGGDMNICVRAHPDNYITRNLKELGFQQIVTEATHIGGGVKDHIYLSQKKNITSKWIVDYFPKYYSDHDGVGLMLFEDLEE